MKIAIAATSKDKNAEVSSRGGRAPYYLIYGEDGQLLEALSNPFAIGGGGAGIAVAKMLADKGVSIVVAGEIGENMKAALNERGLEFKSMSGSASEAAKNAA